MEYVFLWTSFRFVFTIKGDVWEGVVAQGNVHWRPAVSFPPTEYLLSEHFAKEQSPVVIPSHVIVYLPVRRKVETKTVNKNKTKQKF